ncbi:MAG: 3-keto-5-aminohexanoate cleavage protein [Alphaproteobacteria bacterium]|nr:3-keto-5-aminohexanoate cleavage protein [Alphaproteobacteria bacterium]
MTNDIIVNFTPTGIIPTKSQNPNVPISANEIADNVFEAAEIGITSVHLHARNFDGTPAHSAEKYAEIIEKIRKYLKELVICVSLSGRNVYELNQRTAPLYLQGDLKPDMGSLTLSSLNFNNQASINSPQTVMDIASLLKKLAIKPELEVFDLGMINYAKYLSKKGYIRPPYFFNLILGNIASAQANLLHTAIMINDLPENSFYTLGGLGKYQLEMNALAIATDAGVRVGLEDNIFFDQNKTEPASNAELLKRIKRIMEAQGKKVMASKDFRKILNLQPGNGLYGEKIFDDEK